MTGAHSVELFEVCREWARRLRSCARRPGKVSPAFGVGTVLASHTSILVRQMVAILGIPVESGDECLLNRGCCCDRSLAQ